MKAEELLSAKNMKVFNLGAISVVTIAWLVRFYYFSKREYITEVQTELTNADGTTYTGSRLDKSYLQDGFWMVIYTLFVFPVLIFFFLVQLFQV